MTAIPLSESIIERNFKNELLSIENDALAALSKLAKRQYATCVGKKSPIAKCIMVNKDPAIYLLAHRDGHFVILVDDHSTSSLYYSIDGIRKDPQATASWGLLRALDEAGLLLDFKLLKQVMRPVIERLDHFMINDIEPFTTINPSAENLSKYFYDETSKQLAEMTQGRVRVKDCTIWETDTTTATFYE